MPCQRAARVLLPRPIYEYLASGSDDEQTLAENRQAFKRAFLIPRVSARHTITTLTRLACRVIDCITRGS
jgi:isopentenyl diphosphate isomerase/L-lactate dehydrogenase-like FMN-dependent dehydrogenase